MTQMHVHQKETTKSQLVSFKGPFFPLNELQLCSKNKSTEP